MKNIKYIFSIMLSSLITFSAAGSDSVPTLEYLASKAMNPKALAQKILNGTIDKRELDDLETKPQFETLAELVAKELYLLTVPLPDDYKFNALTERFILTYFKGVSIQDLLDKGLLPNVKVRWGRKVLDLKGEHIASLEGYENIPDIEQVFQIDLSTNLIKQLPRDFHLKNLVSLDLSENQLQVMPSQLDLPMLRFLDLTWNQLEDYPDPAGLPSLQCLVMRNNSLKRIPAISYPQLQRFDVANNSIMHIAEGFRLPEVRSLNVKNNQLSNIPSVGAQQPVTVNWEGNKHLTPEAKNNIRQRFPEGSVFIP